ncbi:Nicotinamide-nucleotide amidohydrolase PncC [Symmachiella macrocystis]|uniref:Nicotinamide-nucleotide amidohydrolase PncC n=1 Tax=Symmachiella macrocystis TaxID=2527985 RepID=A0A5C6B5B4_9PLAN|nr:nicotinamide-nucleotide amidohydrolase family protein [Symmachiella macrocystis]TWU07353.1 Nicotinamide-nucleotide amidohydrolase PncC [Symmachiella macrocystis]
MQSLDEITQDLARTLADRQLRVVFAESCTAGLAAATLASVPGISAYLCGSAVTYRERTKQDWLRVSAEDLARFTAVSEPVVRQMAIGVLENTVEADVSAAITGHLGPDAPAEQDGVVYVAVAQRQQQTVHVTSVQRVVLESSTRGERQREATGVLLNCLNSSIQADFV